MRRTRAEIKRRILDGHRLVAKRQIEAAQRAVDASIACGIDPAPAEDQLQKAQAYMMRVELALAVEAEKPKA